MWLVRFFLLSGLLGMSHLQAQMIPEGGGARAGALGQAYTGIQADLWGGMYYNPASLAGLEGLSLGADAEQRWGLSELLTARAAVALPWEASRPQALGLGFATFGFENYQAFRISAGYAIEAFDFVQIGARVHYQGLNVTGYGNGGAILADFGFLARLGEQVTFAGRAHNVNQARLRTSIGEETLTSTLATGLTYQPNDKVILLVDVEKAELSPASLRLGAEYQFHPVLTARVGTHTQPLGWSGGVGLDTQGLRIDLAGRYHERLGFFPQLSLSWQLN